MALPLLCLVWTAVRAACRSGRCHLLKRACQAADPGKLGGGGGVNRSQRSRPPVNVFRWLRRPARYSLPASSSHSSGRGARLKIPGAKRHWRRVSVGRPWYRSRGSNAGASASSSPSRGSGEGSPRGLQLLPRRWGILVAFVPRCVRYGKVRYRCVPYLDLRGVVQYRILYRIGTYWYCINHGFQNL